MPKKPKEPSKCRKWEKDRRDRLKEKFSLLAKVLPCYDPSVKLCHEFILENARITIELLLDEVNKILSRKPENIKDTKDEKIKRLQEKVKRLLTRNEQLCHLLREAGIGFPKVINGQKTVNKLAQNKKKKPKLPTTVAPKHRSEKKTAEPRKKRVSKKKNAITTTGSVCVYLLSQPTTVTAGITQPYYLITNPQNGRNLVTNTPSVPQSTSQTIPLVNVNPIVPTINPGTLYFTNNPIVPQSQIILPATTPLISIPKTITTVSTLPKIITTPNAVPQSQIILPASNPLPTTILKPLVTISPSISTNSVPTTKHLSGPPSPILKKSQTAPIPISLESGILVSESNSLSTSSSVPNIVLTSTVSVPKPVSTSFVSVSKVIPTTLVSVMKTVPTPFVSDSKGCTVTYTASKSTSTTSNIDTNQKKIEEYIKKLPAVAPKRCLTKTTQVNKVPIPALTSKYANSYFLLNDATSTLKNNVKAKKVLRGHGKKTVKRKAEDQQESNIKTKFVKKASDVKIGENIPEGIHEQTDNSQCITQTEHSSALNMVSVDTNSVAENESVATAKILDKCVAEVDCEEDLSAGSNLRVIETAPNNQEVGEILKEDAKNFPEHKNDAQNDTTASLDKLPSITTTIVSTTLPTYSVVTTTSCTISDAHDDIKNLELNLVHSDLSNDLFASLHVPPPGCQNPESTSPTAAFLLAFPLVSSLKANEVMEEDNSDSHRGTPTLLQIGTMDVTKTTQSDSLGNTLLNLENFSFFSGKNIYSEFYTPFNVSNNAQNIVTDSNKQSESPNALNDSFINYIDKNSQQKIVNAGVNSKTCDDNTKSPDKSKNIKANLDNSSAKHEKESSLEVQKQISENPSNNFSNNSEKQKSILSGVHPQVSLNVNNWSSNDFDVSYAVQENTGDMKNDIVVNENRVIGSQNYKTQTNNEPQKEHILTSDPKSSLQLQYGVEQNTRKDANNVQMEMATVEEIKGNKNHDNQIFTEVLKQNSNSIPNINYQNVNKEKDNTNAKNNQCNTEYISPQFADSKNKPLDNNAEQKMSKWNTKPTQEVIKNVESKPEVGNRNNKLAGTSNNHIIHNFNASNQNTGVWPINQYQSKINSSLNIGVQNSNNTENQNTHYGYQQSSTSTQNIENANDKRNLCGWPRNTQEVLNQNYCEKHRPHSTVQYNKTQETQFNSSHVSENLSDNSKNQPTNYWPMDSGQFNNAYNNSAPFGIRPEKLDSKKHEVIQNTPENQKNNIQYPHQALSNSCNTICNKKQNVWTQDWQDVNICYNTFKEISNKDVQKQNSHTWPQEIMNYDNQNSSSTTQKYQMNQDVPVANKKESVNTSWSTVPTQNAVNNFDIQHTMPNVQYVNHQKDKQTRKNVQNVTNNKTNISYNIHQDSSGTQKEIPNVDSIQASKLWSVGAREIQNYEKHRSDFNNHYDMQEKPKETQNLPNNNEKQNINTWPVYPPKEINQNVGKICEKHRNNDFSQANVKFSVPKSNNFGNSCDNIQKINPTSKANNHQNISEQNFDMFLETAKDHLHSTGSTSKKTNNLSAVNNKQSDNYSVNYSKKTSASIENINKPTSSMNKIVDHHHQKVQQTQNSTKTGDQSQKELEQKSQCYFSATYSSSSCNFNYRSDASKSCPTCSYVHLNRNYTNPLYTNSNNYNYNYPDPTFNQSYYKPPISKTEGNYYPFNYDTYQDTSKYYRHSHNFSRDSSKNNGDKCNKEEGVPQNKPVNWMTTPGNKVQTSECLLPTFSSQSYSFTSCITTGEGNEANETKKNPDFSTATEDKQFTWSPTKFPNFLDTSHNFVTPTLPTLVGDLALGNPLTFPDQKTDYNKYSKELKRKSATCDGQPGNFLSVSQLVDHNKSENIPARTTTRRNSGGRSKGASATKKSKIPKNNETVNDKVSQSKQIGSSNISYNVEGQTDMFYEQKSRNTTKNISSNYSAEALIGNQASEVNNKKIILPNKSLGSSNFLTENIITYFPTVDENYTIPGQNFQNNTFSHNNFPNTTYSTNSFIYTASTIPSTYLANSFEPNLTDFSSDNLGMMSGQVRDSSKIDNTKNFRQSNNNKDDKQNNCPNNVKRTNKKKQLVESGSTGVGSALSSFDYPFLVPGSTNSPILPEDFHSHSTFLPPTGTPYPCKTTLYQKQSNDFNPNPLLPLSGLPRSSVPHPEISPSINSAGTSFTNFNLSTIFPEINKGSTTAVFQDNSLKETPVSNSLQVPFNVEPKYSFSS